MARIYYKLLNKLKTHIRKRHQRATSPFCNLPVELVDHIIQHLDPATLCSFRLACKDLYELTLPQFGSRYIDGIIRTDLSVHSLDRLRTLADNPRLGQYVHRLLVTSEDTIYGKGIIWNRHADGHLVDPLRQDGVQQLQRILRSCVNCTSFQIDDSMASEDKYEDQFLTRSDVLTILLNIIADTGLPTTSFLVDLAEDGGSGGCGIDPRRLLNLPNLRGRNFIAAWAHIQELMLDYKMESRVAVDMGITFIQQAPNLQKLSMSFDNGGDAALFLRRLMHMDVLQPPIQLQEVSLSKTFVSGDDLAALLCRVGHSLRVVSFRWVRLTSGSRDRWKEILETLRDQCPYLDTFGLFWSRITPHTLANFPLIAENPIVGAGSEARAFEFSGPRRIGAVKYSGPRMDLALQRLVDSIEYRGM